MDIELISFKLCPFVQRAVIMLLRNRLPYTVTYIDLVSPPDWFPQISPFGKVPVLRIDNQHVVFESAVINEFLNDSQASELLPSDTTSRAISRSWIEFGSTLTLDFSDLIHSSDAEGFATKLQKVTKEFNWLETTLGAGPFFNATTFSLVDIAYAPLFMRIDILGMAESLYPAGNFPKVSAWADALLAIPELPGSVIDGFAELFTSHIKNKAPYVAAQLSL